MSETKYFHSLDLFRGFCDYGVAITHFNAFAFKNVYMEYMSLLFAEFFFVLSGFVLYPQLLKVINNNKSDPKIFARLACSTDSVCVIFFGFTRPAGRTSAYRGSRYRFNDGPKMYQICTKKCPNHLT